MSQQTDKIKTLSNANEEETEIDLLELFYYLKAKLVWLISFFVIGAVIAGLITYFLITPKYTATSKLYMVSASSDSIVNLSDLNLGTSLTDDYVELLKIRPIFEEIIKEGRKFGTFLTISSQRPSDISETIISQLHNYFIHRLVNNEDIRAIGKAVAFIDNTSYEMISVLPQGACIFTGVASNFPVLVQVDLLPKQQQPQSSTINLTELWKEP